MRETAHERVVVQYNKYKKQLIESKIPDGTSTTVYRCGPMIDLCVGPHIPHTGKIKAFMVTKVRDLLCAMEPILKSSSRALPLTSLVTPTTTVCNVSTVSLSQTRTACRSTSSTWRRRLSATTARSVKSKNYFSSTSTALARASSCPTA